MKTQSARTRSDSLNQIMRYVFNPSSVAVIGASRDSEKEMNIGWVGRLVRWGYKGKIYPINPKATEIVGLKAYPSVTSIPDPVDFVTVAVPRELVPQALADCVSKGVKVVHVWTAGFAEAGDEKGKELQAELQRIIRGSNTRLLGPNCMGVYSPAGGLSLDVRFSKESGPVTFVSQTGTGVIRLIYLASGRGLRFSKAISYGNAADLDGIDFLEYAVNDAETKFILQYVEGLKDGQRFLKIVRECVQVKPMVILVGGLSEGGAGAVASHTGSLAGSQQAWQAFFKQTGAIPVDSYEEAVEQLIALQNIPSLTGRRIGLVGRGGGLGVLTTDMCEREGLKVPQFTTETRQRLAEITPATAGSMVRNPVEIGIGIYGVSEYYAEGLRLVASDPNVDLVITYLNPEDYLHHGLGDWVGPVSQQLIGVAKSLSKPLVVTFLPGYDVGIFKATQEFERLCQQNGIACFPNLDVAIKAISKLVAYYEVRSKKSNKEES